jgi:H+/gluconate symporter-like permease
MSLIIVVVALLLLMFVAYRGFSVILFAPVCALLAVFVTDPSLVLPLFSGVFMDKTVGFIKSYFPVFLLARCSARSSSCRAFRNRSSPR